MSIAAIPLTVFSFSIAGFQDSSPHRFLDRDCKGCHTAVPQEGDARPYTFVASVDSLCLKCHANIDVVSHHVNVTPGMNMPDGLPLDERGNINCSTCHDPHSAATDQAGARTHLLRPALAGTGNPCLVCHSNYLSAGGSFTHRSSMLSAHWLPNRDLFSGHGNAPNCEYGPPGSLDSLSMECLTCHDTSAWSNNAKCSMIFMHGEKSGTLHPLGVDYDQAAYDNKSLRTVILDSRIRLFNGKLGCCTCHDPYAPVDGAELRVGEAGNYTQLCNACHL